MMEIFWLSAYCGDYKGEKEDGGKNDMEVTFATCFVKVVDKQ